MTVDTQKLRELIAKATPGPWACNEFVFGEFNVYSQGVSPDITVVFVGHDIRYRVADDMEQHGHDVAYIAAVNPAAMTALLDERDALIHDIGEYVRISSQQVEEIERKDAEIERLRSTAHGFVDEIASKDAEIARLTGALDAIGMYPLARGQEMSAANMRDIARAALSHSQDETTKDEA